MRKTKRILLSLAFLFAAFLSVSCLCFADNSPLGSVTDLSDRRYEQALVELFDNAKESIVISMYGISPGSDGNNPVRLLLKGGFRDTPCHSLEINKLYINYMIWSGIIFYERAKFEV
ncbi:MAG: hypothetical protein ABIC68_04670 [Candidatus Omnitrophota bacterium]